MQTLNFSLISQLKSFYLWFTFFWEKLILILDHEVSRSKSHEMCCKFWIFTKSDVIIVLDYRPVSFHQLFNRKCSACGELLDCKTLISFVSLESWCLDNSKLCSYYWSITIFKIMLVTVTKFSSSAELSIENFLLGLTQLIELLQFWCVRRILIPKKTNVICQTFHFDFKTRFFALTVSWFFHIALSIKSLQPELVVNRSA